MRTSITAYDKESEKYWTLMNQYSKLLGKVVLYKDPKDLIEKSRLEELIPNSIRQTYLNARRKKHEINLYFLEQLKEGFIEYLVLLQEDSMKDGIQQVEQKILESYIKQHHLEHNSAIYNGTDEGTLVLLAKVLLQEKKIRPTVFIHLPNQLIKSKIMPFEDRPLQNNLFHLFEAVGLQEVSTPEQADFIVAIYSEMEPYDLDLNAIDEIKPHKNDEFKAFFESMQGFIDEGYNVAFVDLLFPNGGSVDLLNEIDYMKLVAYSAWNTATNSLGSMLANIAVLAFNEHANSTHFLHERLLDDCIYQTYTRRKINVEASKAQMNIFDLKENAPTVLDKIQTMMEQDNTLLKNVKFQVSLPWNRTFEIDIETE
jgi:hypothetical protein